MRLNELTNNKKNRKRVGRGIGSGKGKTAGRGHKGQKSRSGVAVKGFEGGQMPIYRRLPKVGFNNIFRVEFQTINVGELEGFVKAKKLDGTKVINKKILLEARILKKSGLPFKVLGKGKITSAIKIEADAASEAAIKLIEKAGGKVTLPKKEDKAA